MTTAARADEDEDATRALYQHVRHHQHGGITQFVEQSLDTLGEEPSKQQKVDELAEQLHACTEPLEQAEQQVLGVIADGAAAGRLDTAKAQLPVAQIEGAGAAIHGCVAKPLNELHALLSAPERNALAYKVRAHWAVWRHLNVDLPLSSRDKEGAIEELVHELKLDAKQGDALVKALEGSQPTKLDKSVAEAQVEAFEKAFDGAGFDATKVTTQSTGSLSVHGAQRMIAFYQAAIPILSADQRTQLASHLREHAGHHQKVTVNP
jgi:hypothetical protein